MDSGGQLLAPSEDPNLLLENAMLPVENHPSQYDSTSSQESEREVCVILKTSPFLKPNESLIPDDPGGKLVSNRGIQSKLTIGSSIPEPSFEWDSQDFPLEPTKSRHIRKDTPIQSRVKAFSKPILGPILPQVPNRAMIMIARATGTNPPIERKQQMSASDDSSASVSSSNLLPRGQSGLPQFPSEIFGLIDRQVQNANLNTAQIPVCSHKKFAAMNKLVDDLNNAPVLIPLQIDCPRGPLIEVILNPQQNRRKTIDFKSTENSKENVPNVKTSSILTKTSDIDNTSKLIPGGLGSLVLLHQPQPPESSVVLVPSNVSTLNISDPNLNKFLNLKVKSIMFMHRSGKSGTTSTVLTIDPRIQNRNPNYIPPNYHLNRVNRAFNSNIHQLQYDNPSYKLHDFSGDLDHQPPQDVRQNPLVNRGGGETGQQ